MRKIIFLVALLVFTPCLNAQEITLEWDAVNDADLDHYNVYQANRVGDHSGPWSHVKTVPATETTAVVEVPDGSNFAWLVTAVDKNGNESRPSNFVERVDRTPPVIPSNLDKQK